MKKRKLTSLRLCALLLTVATLLSVVPMGIYAADSSAVSADEDAPKVIVLHNGAQEPTVVLNENESETLTAFISNSESNALAWQIRTPDGSQWVKIYGKTGVSLLVNLALIGSMLTEDAKAYLRCALTDGDEVYYSEPVEISVSYSAGDSESLYGDSSASPMRFSQRPAQYVAAEDSTEEKDDLELVTVVINYIFDNGGMAFEPYGASIAKGSDFSATINSPSVVGYEPYRRIDGNYLEATKVVFDLKNVTENVVVNVIYMPALVKYEVHHHLQGLYNDDYSVEYDYITRGTALTGSITPKTGLALELPGFRALPYEQLTVAADGSTVVEIRYDRNYYLVSFNMEGGFGTEPIYTRFGSLVGANPPTRHGYVFNGWVLDTYNGKTPTVEQASHYDINAGAITLPDANLVYRAIWITQSTTYTMVFWRENIDDNGFSYWGHLEGLSAMSGTPVSGSNRVGEVSDITDEKFFTYCAALTDKDVIVEGDGSTIVNVYYTRNRYSITFKATGLCSIPEKHTHGDDCYVLLCSKGHQHTDDCTPTLTCTKREHTAHTAECIICGKTEHAHSSACCGLSDHTHTVSCWENVGSITSKPTFAPYNPVDGQIYKIGVSYYYIYIKGSWYRYNKRLTSGVIVDTICNKTEHTHGSSDCKCPLSEHTHIDSCYRDTFHTHSEANCYKYSCGKIDHVHSDGCYLLNCGIVQNHTHSASCKDSRSTNVVKTVYKKYQQDLSGIWPIVDDNGVTYNKGERWKPSESTDFSQVLVFIANMPGDDFTLTVDKVSYDTFTMNYYLEVLPRDNNASDVIYDSTYKKYFRLYTTVKANYNYLTEAEDFFPINGYYKLGSNPAFSGGQVDINGGGTVNMYYARNVNQKLEFQSNGIVLDDHTKTGIMYGESIKNLYFVPEYPSTLEPNAYVFGGWYTSPGHFDGTEVNWDTATMAASDALYYAKWSPIVHEIKVYLTSELKEQIGSTQYVDHNAFAHAPEGSVTNGNYIFQGWFYKDSDGKEKAFVFSGIPVIDDMTIYAKWSSHVSVNYTINYVLRNTDGTFTVIADPTVGSAIAGHNKTFPAKAGSELYSAYQKGYYPLTNSHTVTMSAESDHEYTFVYVFVESMPYLVRYVDKATGATVAESKKVLDNNLSVVTETFVRVTGMMPDAYQKRLVLSADTTDSDNDGIYDGNVITFNYTQDTVHAYCHVVHYIQDINDNQYREYRSEDIVDEIGKELSFSAITLTGFAFNGALTKVDGTLTNIDGNTLSVRLDDDGLLIEFYYDRVNVSYVVNYLETGTNKVLHTQKSSSGIFGGQVVEQAPLLTHLGYKLVSEEVQMIHLSTNEALNVINFYYQESIYSIQYIIVGATEGGTLSQSSENIYAVSTQTPIGSQPYVQNGYHFVGWYLDEACTRPVDGSWIDENYKLVAKRDGDVWLANLTFYAKIDPNFTTLTISTLGAEAIDEGQMFVYRIKGISDDTNGIDLTVSIPANSSVTVSDLMLGKYEITELSEWSFRYQPDSKVKNITLVVDTTKNAVSFDHARVNTGWLDGNHHMTNDFVRN